MIKFHPSDDPRITSSVRFKRFPMPWGAEHESAELSRWLSDLTFRNLRALGPGLRDGCHFVLPRGILSSDWPSATYFREAINRRGLWICGLRRELGSLRFRQLSDSLSPSARQATLTGFMYIHGDLIPPRTWQAQADEWLKPNVTRRKPDLTDLKATGDPEFLKAISLSELHEHLVQRPFHAAYVNPLATVPAPTATPAFYEAAERAQAEWYALLNRTLGSGKVRHLRRSSDTVTDCLVFSGTLLVDGLVYLPGLWATHDQKPGRLKKTPFQSPTVPLEFLGLGAPPVRLPERRGDDLSAVPEVPDSGKGNEQVGSDEIVLKMVRARIPASGL